MDYRTRKLLGFTDIHLHFDDDWLEERNHKGIQAQVIKGKLVTSPSRCENCGSAEIIHNEAYTPHSQMLKVKERLPILQLKRTRFLCHACRTTFSAQIDLDRFSG